METMTVTIRDRSREAPWGRGLTDPITRKVTIVAAAQLAEVSQ